MDTMLSVTSEYLRDNKDAGCFEKDGRLPVKISTQRNTSKRLVRKYLIGLFLLFAASLQQVKSSSMPAQEALQNALKNTSAGAVVLDIASGKILAEFKIHAIMEQQTFPGSTLKPLFLAAALKNKQIKADETVFCRRHLTIAHRDIACTHPQTESVFNAEEALAYSCNQYFVELAKRFTPKDAAAVLKQFHLPYAPRSTEEIELAVLGLNYTEITPLQLAESYRQLALQIMHTSSNSPLHVVKRGLEGSVQYGMAHNAITAGLAIAGKTGTASDPGQAWTHGLFAGFAPADAPRVVVVVYVPKGNGAGAAHLAQKFFQAYKSGLQ
jgi:cell division protein FtsI/penicillin-binding protein 2